MFFQVFCRGQLQRQSKRSRLLLQANEVPFRIELQFPEVIVKRLRPTTRQAAHWYEGRHSEDLP
jgi:hypothetical protein